MQTRSPAADRVFLMPKLHLLDGEFLNSGRRAPKGSIVLKTIESHAAGEPLRLVIEGWPNIPGASMLAKRSYAKKHYDHWRRLLMSEPRGHRNMYGAALTRPVTKDGDLGVLFMHNEGFSTMCGHGVVALVTSLIEAGSVRAHGANRILHLDTPAGRVTATAKMKGTRVENVSFENVPSFVLARDQNIDVDGVGSVRYDLAFGGAFYAYCKSSDLRVGLTPADSQRLVEIGMRIKLAIMTQRKISHPTQKDLAFLYGTIITGEAQSSAANIRNVCIFADGQIDRSPTGTGVSGHVAIEHAKGNLRIGKSITVEAVRTRPVCVLVQCFLARIWQLVSPLDDRSRHRLCRMSWQPLSRASRLRGRSHSRAIP